RGSGDIAGTPAVGPTNLSAHSGGALDRYSGARSGRCRSADPGVRQTTRLEGPEDRGGGAEFARGRGRPACEPIAWLVRDGKLFLRAEPQLAREGPGRQRRSARLATCARPAALI